jgi:transposase
VSYEALLLRRPARKDRQCRLQAGASKSGAARLFGVSLSSAVKRYARIAGRGDPLKPTKGGGRPPKTDQTTRRKLLEEDVKEQRRGATVADRRRFLHTTTGNTL